MKKLFFLISACISLVLLPTVSMAYDEPTYYGLDETAAQAGLQQPVEAPTIIGNVIGNALTLIGVIFFILMVYGGFLWMTAHGDSGQVDKAKETIIAAVIGMIVVLGSYSLTQFILSAPTGGAPAPAPAAAGSENGDVSNQNLDFAIACTNNSDCDNGLTCINGSCAVDVANPAPEPPPAPVAINCDPGGNRAQCIAIQGCSWVELNAHAKCVTNELANQCNNEATARENQNGCKQDPECLGNSTATQLSCLGM